MPFKAGEVSKCPTCDKAVYAAEEKIAGGHRWHKGCFKCSMCNKLLDSTSCAEHENKLYCKTCYGRKFGPKGYGFGGGAAGLTMDNGEAYGNTEFQTNGSAKGSANGLQAPKGQGCPRCGCFVYHADQILSKGRIWHKQCFKCRTCHRSLDSRTACDGPDNEVYCNVCYRKGFGLKGYGFGQGGPALLSGDITDGQDQQAAGIRFIDVSIIRAEGGPGCPRCGGKVFHAEQMFSKSKTYHKRCFTCNTCKRPLDSVLACDGPDDEIYCKGCYGKKFGAKGYGFAGGCGFLQSGDMETSENGRPHTVSDVSAIKGELNDRDTCPRCKGKVFHAERMLSKNNVFHKTCFTCRDCARPLDSTSCCDAPDDEIYCRACYGKRFGPHGYGYGGSGSTPALMAAGPGQNEESKPLIDFHPGVYEHEERVGGTAGCPRCGYRVYDAEKMMAAGRNWHKRCFSCFVCKRHLDSTTVNDGTDGEIYCRSCHSGKFGLKGYGFGQGAGTLLSDGHGFGKNSIAMDNAFILP